MSLEKIAAATALLVLTLTALCGISFAAPSVNADMPSGPAPAWSWTRGDASSGGPAFEAADPRSGLRMVVTTSFFRLSPPVGKGSWSLLVVPRGDANPVDPSGAFSMAGPGTLASEAAAGRVWYTSGGRGFLRGLALSSSAFAKRGAGDGGEGGDVVLEFDLAGALHPLPAAGQAAMVSLAPPDGEPALIISARTLAADGADIPSRFEIAARPRASMDSGTAEEAAAGFTLRLVLSPRPSDDDLHVEMLFATPESLAAPEPALESGPESGSVTSRTPEFLHPELPAMDAEGASGETRSANATAFFAPPSEINNSLVLFTSGATTTLQWSDGPGPYTVYRGSRAAGSPFAYNHACIGAVSAPTASDPLNPPPGGVFYYLIARYDLCSVESVVGRNSAGAPDPPGTSCVTPTVCSAQDVCHSAGTCDGATGACSNPTRPDGTPCASNDACAPASACAGGSCSAPGPGFFAPGAKPYFMIVADTSSSLPTSVGTPSACGYGSTRSAHLRCGLRNIVQAYAGEVGFGLAGYAALQNSCAGACFTGCNVGCYPQESTTTGQCLGCGPKIGADATTRAGARILVPIQQDNWWNPPPFPSNAASIVSWMDNDCTGSTELWQTGSTPWNGVLRDMKKYFQSSWTSPDGSSSFSTPLSALDRACRVVNVILVTDSDEGCDLQSDAVSAATALNATGVVIGTTTYHIRTHVINFAGATQANTDALASAGGTGASYFVTNETQLQQALTTILQSTLQAETCDNLDNDCNGCVDEGFKHYFDVQPLPGACCAWGTQAQRATCLNTWRASITNANPQGNRALLPCTTAAQQSNPATWLCFDPGDSCDGVDNNGQAGVDEGAVKCGSPPHCIQPETCNGLDDNCNGIVDEGACQNGCVWHPEICDGCDNDCDGIADDGIGPIPCGAVTPSNCSGMRFCSAPTPVPAGTCVAGGWSPSCQNSPQTETCDGIDNDCNGAVDDSALCACASRQEVCNGLDDNCNGSTDEGVIPPSPATVCGVNAAVTSPECTSQVQVLCQGGSWHCVFPAGVCNGAGGCSGTAEVCDALDNNCNGLLNENVPDFGQPCASDDGVPAPGHGRCRTIGTRICNGPAATACSAVKANCATLPGGCTETCDGIDNDCDGLIDESTINKGAAPATYVKPNVTRVAAGLWIDSYETSRPSATLLSPGVGNGYWCASLNAGDIYCNDATLPFPQAGTPLDKTPGCSEPQRLPWVGATPAEAAQVCKSRGGRVCTTTELQSACGATVPCTYGYNPRGAACTTTSNGTKYCNLAPSFDTDTGTAGNQDDPISSGSVMLPNCWADWSGLQGNTASSKIYDITGNLREVAKVGTGQYALMGGAFDTDLDAGATCSNTSYTATNLFTTGDTGFRCCYDADPR